jgi:hypothetical protein
VTQRNAQQFKATDQSPAHPDISIGSRFTIAQSSLIHSHLISLHPIQLFRGESHKIAA